MKESIYLSKYNFYVEYGLQTYIYNLKTRKILPIDKEKSISINEWVANLSCEKTQKMLEFGFIRKVNTDETAEMLRDYNNQMCNSLDIMLVVTNACNFACKYCYEKKANETIDHRFISTFSQYLNENISNYKSVFIEWFGGEPLIAKEQILTLSNAIKDICSIRKKAYIGSMTTNGYLLEPKLFEQLLDAKILFYQITIDGDEYWHNTYRPLVNGNGTYSTIMDNLITIRDYIPKRRFFKIVIRNNVSRENMSACDRFENEFTRLFGDDYRFELTKYPISNWGGDGIEKLRDVLIKDTESEYFKAKTYKNDLFESIGSKCCRAVKKNGFVIEPNYKIFKCNHHIDAYNREIRNNEIGKMDFDGKLSINEELNDKWCKKELISECRDCTFLPVCIGKCPLSGQLRNDDCREKEYKILTQKIENYLKMENKNNG